MTPMREIDLKGIIGIVEDTEATRDREALLWGKGVAATVGVGVGGEPFHLFLCQSLMPAKESTAATMRKFYRFSLC